MSQATFYKWRSKYGDANVNIVKRLKELEVKNSRLKKMYADERLMSQIRK
jgi:putative transposase